MSTDQLTEWRPDLYVDGQLGKFGNTYRLILTLEVGDYIDLAKVIEGAANIKSAVIWRTKDGWELRGVTYSGGYGLSIEPEDVKKDKSYFDKILVSLDSEPPFPDFDVCKCNCGSPTTKEFIKGHESRLKYQLAFLVRQGNPNAEIEAQQYGWNFSTQDNQEVVDEEAEEPTQPAQDEPPASPDGEETPRPTVETEGTGTPDVEAPPEEDQSPDPFSTHLAAKMFGEEENTDEAEEPETEASVTEEDLPANLDNLIYSENTTNSFSPVDTAMNLVGIVDPYVDVAPFEDMDVCACGCGNVVEDTRYIDGHNQRHKLFLSKSARGLSRIPSGLPNSSKRYTHYKLLDPGEGTPDEQLKTLSDRRDATDSPVAKILLNEAMYRIRADKQFAVHVRPSNNAKLLNEIALRFAVADVGELVPDNAFNTQGYIIWSSIDVRNKNRLKTYWTNHKQKYLNLARSYLDDGSPDRLPYDVAVQKKATLVKRAMLSGMLPSEFIKQGLVVQYPNGNPSYTIETLVSGNDEEVRSPVSSTSYKKYRDMAELNGADVDVRANFYNHVVLDMSNSNFDIEVETQGDPDVFTDAIALIYAVVSGEYDKNLKFLKYFSEWWNNHGNKAAGYDVTPSDILAAKNAQDYTRFKMLGLNSRFNAVYMMQQRLDKIDYDVQNGQSRSVFLSGSPLREGHYDSYLNQGKPHAMAFIDQDSRPDFMGKMLDLGGRLQNNKIVLVQNSYKILYAPDETSINDEDNKKRMAAANWITSNLKDDKYYLITINDESKVSAVINSSGDFVWVSGNATPDLLSKIDGEFLYNPNSLIKYAGLISDDGHLLFKNVEEDSSLDQSILDKMEEAELNIDPKIKLTLKLMPKLSNGNGGLLSLATFYNLYLNKQKMGKYDLQILPEAGSVEFVDLIPSRVAGWFVNQYGSVVEPQVPYGALNSGFVHSTNPRIFQDEFADGSVKPQFNESGLVRRFGTESSDLKRLIDRGAIESGDDGMAYLEFSPSGGSEYLDRFKYAVVFKTDIIMANNVVIAGRNYGPLNREMYRTRDVKYIANLQSADVGIPYEARLEDAYAIIVPINEDAQLLDEFSKKYPHIKIIHSDGSNNVLRSLIENTTAEYNRIAGFNNRALFAGAMFSDNNQMFERGIKPNDYGIVVTNSSDKAWLLPVRFTKVLDSSKESANLQVRVLSTPAVRDNMKNRSFSDVITRGGFYSDESFVDQTVNVSSVVWLSPRMIL